MDPQHLLGDCLIHVFTFLTEEDLIRASSVCMNWHNAAETPWLWRRMCLQRWGFCSQAVLGSPHVNHSWKKYFLRRSHLETKMKEGRTGGYTCKSLRGHTGQIVGLVYLQGSSPLGPDLWDTPTTVCSASTDGTVRAWNIQNGQLMWCTAKQNPLSRIIIDEQRDFVITVDSAGLIKVWQGQTGQEVASYSVASAHCTLLQYNKDNDWFLSVGTSPGSVCTLAGTALTKKSSIMVCDSFKVNILLVSPDKKWITAGSKDNVDSSLKVIYADSLTSPCEDEDLLCQLVPVTGCQAAVFIPTQSARLAMVHCNEHTNNKALTVFDVSMKKSKYTSQIQVQQVESSPLSLPSTSSNILLEAKDSNSIVMAVDCNLFLYSLNGALLASFKEHTMPITSLCVDTFGTGYCSLMSRLTLCEGYSDKPIPTELSCRGSAHQNLNDLRADLQEEWDAMHQQTIRQRVNSDSFRVVTASQDLSLRVLTWKRDRDGGLNLESRYHLLGGSHTMSRGFSLVACDYASVVGSVEGKDSNDALKAYTFTS